MRRRIALLVAVLTAAAVAITVSSAQSGQRDRTTSFGGTIKAALVDTRDGALIIAGEARDRRLGRGAILYDARLDSATGRITARFEALTPRGSIVGRSTAVQRTDAGGTTTVEDGVFRSNGRRNTGVFKGKRVRAEFTGSLSGTVFTFTYSGTLR